MKKLLLLLILPLLLLAENNQTKEVSYFDKQDGMLDLSEHLSQAYGFLPLPKLITEPAVGYGLGLGLIYLHGKLAGKRSASGRRVPPSISGLVALGTQNGTKFGGAFHIGYWLDDDIRSVSFIGYGDVNVDIFTDRKALSANIKAPFTYQAIKFRILDLPLFLGTGFAYGQVNSKLGDRASKEETTSALQLIAEYDTRNNTLSPTKGYFLSAKANLFSKKIGSDNTFQRYMSKGLFYIPVTNRVNFNMSITMENMNGSEAPFYTYPFVMLRGMPAMKVQGENVLSNEVEVSWNFAHRYDAIVFGGLGKAFGSDQFGQGNVSFSEAKNHYTKGIGFRYLIARQLGLKVGVDIASSEDDAALYIQFGSAWSGF